MSSPFVAEIRIFPFGFAPKGWAFCNGAQLLISQNTALFSLLGTTYGGDGASHFALPDLQGNVPLHPGQGPGLSAYTLGETAGSATVTLAADQVPAETHTHNVQGSVEAGDDTATPSAGTTLGLSAPDPIYSKVAGDPLVQFSSKTIGMAGDPHENRQPYMALNFCIALQGIFPVRN